ncbi:MAG: low temperature requirement protein A, partial [Caldilineaceae bacterium]|nr:low temperature requirement protein A [Caldilineaceae bacterium]
MVVTPNIPRDINEPHRSATPLELLFDLVSVIAIAAAASGLHHAIVEDHILDGLLRYSVVFFGIWWAWMNYTWFASAYDSGDNVFKLLTMVIMAGSLTMAAGVTVFFDGFDIALLVIGYVIMRLALVALWVRASFADPERSKTTRIYAGGITLAQVFWVALWLSQPLDSFPFYFLFALGVLLELSVPVIAERQNYTPWHRDHIVERYGLLNIIVLGETLLAATVAVERAVDGDFDIALVQIALSALVILFSMWWLYFAREEHLDSRDLSRALPWGYGHAIIFLSGAAVGAGIAALIDIMTGHAQVGIRVGEYAVAIPVALYLLGLWFVRDRFVLRSGVHFLLPVIAVIILVVPVFFSLGGVAILIAAGVIARSVLAEKNRAASL